MLQYESKIFETLLIFTQQIFRNEHPHFTW